MGSVVISHKTLSYYPLQLFVLYLGLKLLLRALESLVIQQRQIFYIPISWQLCDTLSIEAKTLEEAIALAQKEDLPDGIYIRLVAK
jgi:hypothetical protein